MSLSGASTPHGSQLRLGSDSGRLRRCQFGDDFRTSPPQDIQSYTLRVSGNKYFWLYLHIDLCVTFGAWLRRRPSYANFCPAHVPRLLAAAAQLLHSPQKMTAATVQELLSCLARYESCSRTAASADEFLPATTLGGRTCAYLEAALAGHDGVRHIFSISAHY